MRIQAINQSFRGLFIDKTSSNNNNWRMEYAPYSWESNNTSKMTSHEKLNIFANGLPDNEEIYESFQSDNQEYKELSKDILGTISYYKRPDGIMRRTITEVPALSREESLIVQNKKLEKFLSLKDIEKEKLEQPLNYGSSVFDESKEEFKKYSDDLSSGYFARAYSKDTSIAKMNEEYDRTKEMGLKLLTNFQLYKKLQDSIDSLKSLIEANKKELEQIADLKRNHQLIDISRRDIANPNEALISAMNGKDSVLQKFLSLPHKLVPMAEILESVTTKIGSKFPATEDVCHYVETLIKKSV